MDKNNGMRNKRHFNFADAIIIVVLLVVISLMAKLFIGNFSAQFPIGNTLEYVVEVENIPADIVSLFENGQPVTEHITGKTIGTVSNIEIAGSVYSEYNSANNEYDNYIYPDIFDMRITISSPYNTSDNIYDINGVKIIVGKHISFRTPTAYAAGTFSGIYEKTPTPPEMFPAKAQDSAREVKNDE